MAKMIKALIFDLDDTLCDSSGAVMKNAVEDGCKAAAMAGLDIDVKKFSGMVYRKKVKETLSFKKCIREMVGDIVKDRDKAEKIIAAANNAYYGSMHFEDFELLPGAKEMLSRLKKKYWLFLVTFGYKKRQLKKIDALGINSFFKEIGIIEVNDTKKKIFYFESILKRHKLSPHEVVCIGNRIDDEIEDAEKLNIRTILYPHGEYGALKPHNIYEKADFVVRDIVDVEKVLNRLK